MTRRITAVSLIMLLGSLSVATPVAAAPARNSGSLQLDVRVDGHRANGGRLRLDPAKPARIVLTMHNTSGFPVQVRTVRLAGTALGLTFFAYDTSVAVDVSGGEDVTQGFNLDLSDLDSQVTGLLPAKVVLLDDSRHEVAVAATTADVQGSLLSVYGFFGIGVFVLTVLSWAGALFALARQLLPQNRWRRALRFLPAGVGTGLTAVITLSVLRIVAPSPVAEIPLVLGLAAAAFGLGYLTPNPDTGEPGENADPDDAPETGGPAVRGLTHLTSVLIDPPGGPT